MSCTTDCTVNLLLFFMLGYVPIYCSGGVSKEYIGCFKDTPKRAMPILLSPTTNLLESCRNEADFNGYKVFGIQNQRECWSGPNAHNTYNKHGPSSDCVNGLGGAWTNSVYRITSDGAALAEMLKDVILKAMSIDDVDVGAFVTSSSKLLNLSTAEWKKNSKMADNFLSASEGLLSLGMNATNPVAATTNLMVFSVTKVDTTNKTSLVFPDYSDPTFSKQSSSNSFIVPAINNSDSANIGGYVYSNLHEKLTTALNESDPTYKRHLNQQIISYVLSCQVDPPIVFGLNTNETIHITLEHNVPLVENAIAICAFWKHPESNDSSGVWSTEGCNVIFSNTTHTQCSCTHLTNFAILMQHKDVELGDDHRRALTILTNIGCSLSLAALFVTITIYFAFGLYRATNFHIHINLCVAIAMAQIFLLCASQARDNEATCVVMSGFLHYFCLCVFTWMLVEGIQIYKKVVSIFSSSLNLIYCHLIGWGLPVLIVVITYGARKDHYTDLETCWLSPNYGIRWAFIGPVLAVITINIIVTMITLQKRLKLRSITTKEMAFKIRTSLRALFVLLPIFGLTWLIGIFGFSSDAVAAMYIFVIFNAFQGLFIFVFHCALNAEVRKAVFQGRRLRIHTRTGTLSSGANKQSLKQTTSKNSDDSNKESDNSSRPSSRRSIQEPEIKEDIQLTVTLSPKSTHLVP